jgi:hypothetical protein
MVGPRELERDIGRQSAAVPGSSFTGQARQGPRAAGPGANISGYNSERSYATDSGHGGSPSEEQPGHCQIHGLLPGKKTQWGGAGRRAAGRTNIASGLFANGRGQRKRGHQLKGRTSRGEILSHLGNGSSSRLIFFGDYGTAIRAFSVIFANIVC